MERVGDRVEVGCGVHNSNMVVLAAVHTTCGMRGEGKGERKGGEVQGNVEEEGRDKIGKRKRRG